MKTKPYIFLDMDSTLIKTYRPRELVGKYHLQEVAMPILDKKVTIPRPGLIEFLTSLNEFSEVCLFTAAEIEYANSIVDSLNIRHYFQGIHSAYGECPNSLKRLYGLENKTWFLVEDTPHDHELTIFKLQCLGMTNGKELNASHKVIMTKSYHPESYPQNDHDLPRVLDEIKKLIKVKIM